MGLGLGIDSDKIETLSIDIINESKKKEDEIEVTGCWIKFRFLGRCISTRSKVESSNCVSTSPDGNLLTIFFYAQINDSTFGLKYTLNFL